MSKKSQSSQKPSLKDFFTELQLMRESVSAIEPLQTSNVESIADDAEEATDFLSCLKLLDSQYKDLHNILTERQVATIRKRVETVKGRRKSATRTDVRSIFMPSDDDVEKKFDNALKINDNHLSVKNDEDSASSGRSSYDDKYDWKEILSVLSYEAKSDDGGGGEDDSGDDDGDGEKEGVKEEKEIEEKKLKLLSIPPLSDRSVKKEDSNSFILSGLFSRSQSSTIFAPPTPTLFPDKFDKSIALEETRLEDLGQKDQKTVETLAYIELMGVFDNFKIDLMKKKSSRKNKIDKEGVYGVSLETLKNRDVVCLGHKTSTPLFFKQLLKHIEDNHLSQEGILRLSGSFSRIKELRRQIDEDWYNKKFTFEGLRVHDAVGLLKLFLRDLPSPLLGQWIDTFVQVSKIPNVCMQKYSVSLLMILLPPTNRAVLKMLLLFLKKVSEESERNRMSVESICMVMAPNLFLHSFPNTDSHVDKLEKEMGVATRCTSILQIMLLNIHEIFIVPAALINQVRQKNHRENKKKRNFWSKKEKFPLIKSPTNLQICVTLEPYPDNVCFKIKKHSTVADVIYSVVLHSSRAKPDNMENILEKFCMYEKGGNIGERRLDNSTKLCNIVAVNPQATYVIKLLPPTSPSVSIL